MMASKNDKPNGKPKTDAELWDTLQADAELDRIKHLSPAEVDAELRAAGGDPDAIGRRGAAHAAKHLPERALDGKSRAKARQDAMDRTVGEWPRLGALPRAELLARVRAARADTQFAAPVVMAFRKRAEEEATDDELRAVLEEIEVLRRLHGVKAE
jgi:hypothetical protein